MTVPALRSPLSQAVADLADRDHRTVRENALPDWARRRLTRLRVEHGHRFEAHGWEPELDVLEHVVALAGNDPAETARTRDTLTANRAEVAGLLAQLVHDRLTDAAVALVPAAAHHALADGRPGRDRDPDGLALRPDGRYEVADGETPDRLYGCQVDGWCVLVDGHAHRCDETRDVL